MVEKNEKCTFKAPRGEKWNKLNLTARAVYIVIAAHSSYDDNKCSCLSRERISKMVGIKNLDDVTKYTNQLRDSGFIKKEIKWVKTDDKRCIYEITVDDNYSLVKNDIVRSGLTSKQMALFCTIASLRYQRSHRVRVSYQTCGVAQKTFGKYLKELVALNVIGLDDNYVTFKKFVMCDDYKTNKKLSQILNEADKESRAYKMALYAVEHPKSIDNIDAYVDYIWSGTKRHSDKKVKQIKVSF